MNYFNNETLIRRELLVQVAKVFLQNQDLRELDLIPLKRAPKRIKTDSRCCPFKERAVIRARIIAILGFDPTQDDEITKLSEYAERALQRQKITENVLSVSDEACSGCVVTNYFVTNACRGCVARPCLMNCPRHAIEMVNGHAQINPEKCVNCGLCVKVCPYHAITYIPIPCAEACPVGAVSKDEDNLVRINDKACIHCGKCMRACPFGAIMEKSQIVDVLKAMQNGREVVALTAPAIAGQFAAEYRKIAGALHQLGFKHVMEVAYGADITVKNEATELLERLENGDPFMTTSCCPAYTEAVEKHIPELAPRVSHTRSPMAYIADYAYEKHPDCVTVFIGPCLAKKQEAFSHPHIKYVLSFEELGALFIAAGIDIDKMSAANLARTGSKEGRGFAVSGGVTGAIQKHLGEQAAKFKPLLIDGITKTEISKLRVWAKNPPEGNFLEVMSCQGGCLAGPDTISNVKIGRRFLDTLLQQDPGESEQSEGGNRE